MNFDSDNPSLSYDHGLNMDSAPASHDNPSNNSDLTLATTDNPGIHPGPSSTQQSSANVVSGHVRCVNCGINVSRMRRHLLEITEVRNLVQRWVEPQQVQVSSDNVVCSCSFMLDLCLGADSKPTTSITNCWPCPSVH